jgi:hypothetical protein
MNLKKKRETDETLDHLHYCAVSLAVPGHDSF